MIFKVLIQQQQQNIFPVLFVRMRVHVVTGTCFSLVTKIKAATQLLINTNIITVCAVVNFLVLFYLFI